jgi:predicted AlkP superfamily pyrophosphatase or phosphodiesterase
MFRKLSFIIICFFSATAFAQPAKPKLVVGLVIDQMRWDYLYRYSDLYGTGGFKRLLNQGFSNER